MSGFILCEGQRVGAGTANKDIVFLVDTPTYLTRLLDTIIWFRRKHV